MEKPYLFLTQRPKGFAVRGFDLYQHEEMMAAYESPRRSRFFDFLMCLIAASPTIIVIVSLFQ